MRLVQMCHMTALGILHWRSRKVLHWLRAPIEMVQQAIDTNFDEQPSSAAKLRFIIISIIVIISPRAHLHAVGMLWFMSGINQPSLPTPFYSVLVSISVFMALSTVFHSISSPDNSPFSDSVLPVLSLPYWSFQLYISLWKPPPALIESLVVDRAQNTN